MQKVNGAASSREYLPTEERIGRMIERLTPKNGESSITLSAEEAAFISSELKSFSQTYSLLYNKLVESNSKKIISEFMTSYLSEIEREIINSSKSHLKLHQKIRKLSSEFIKTNYFKELYVVTEIDGMVDSLYGEDFSLSNYIFNSLKPLMAPDAPFEQLKEKYRLILDNVDLVEVKVAFRKTIIEARPPEDIICDYWKKLEALIGHNNCFIIFHSLSLYRLEKEKFANRMLTPLLADAEMTGYVRDSKFKRVISEGKEYYLASIYTYEDRISEIERFINKLHLYNYHHEADILYSYLSNNTKRLTAAEINHNFSHILKFLLDELHYINNSGSKKKCVGHIILSRPTEELFESDGSFNFVASMLLNSLYKMSEIILINDFEFQEFQKEMLITLQQISQLRDIETANHQDRVTIFTKILAQAILEKKEQKRLKEVVLDNNMPIDSDYFIVDREYIRDLLYSASLHDLGKLGIDDNILKNPNRLTDSEYEKMKQHTIYGKERLLSITKISRKKSFLVMAAAVAESHHERWDGYGYPHGRKGFEIPLSARILAISDVYDALRKRRTYKKALSHEEVVTMMMEKKGYHFDPVLIDLFYEYNDKFNEAFESHKSNC